jgi:hypothetical protein
VSLNKRLFLLKKIYSDYLIIDLIENNTYLDFFWKIWRIIKIHISTSTKTSEVVKCKCYILKSKDCARMNCRAKNIKLLLLGTSQKKNHFGKSIKHLSLSWARSITIHCNAKYGYLLKQYCLLHNNRSIMLCFHVTSSYATGNK